MRYFHLLILFGSLFSFILFFNKLALSHTVDQIFLNSVVFSDTPNTAKSELYLSWQQLGYILDKYGSLPEEKKQPVSDDESLNNLFKMYKEYNTVFVNYFNKNLQVTSHAEICKLNFLENTKIDKEEILGGRGYRFILDINCAKGFEKEVVFKTNMFVPEYPYQQMFVNLVSSKGEFNILLTKEENEKDIFYKVPSPNQTIKSNSLNPFAAIVYFFKNLKLERNFFDTLKSGSILSLVLLFFIGALHTLEAGHSKAIIFSLASNSNTSFKQGLSYVLVFTITHVADILLLALIFLVLNSTVDIYKNLPLLTTFSLYSLLIFSLYLLITSIKNYFKNKTYLEFPKEIDHKNFLQNKDIPIQLTHTHGGSTHTHALPSKEHSLKKQIVVGFLAGLAPCFMGWSIFLVILSSKRLFLIIPLIISFALGIAFTLTLFLVLALKLKKPLYGKFSFIGEISPIISALILLLYSIYALAKL